ncbi:MAG: NAD-dependent epimerase/dehydratase [Candidatus Nomurabacteria bacterium GW2011_GWE1_35_16]|uniref:NAD-dependent epimerase/dehydratase n=1 Tax=Candidatus Nomurabacteria bacterium GW2011_GWE1_35_16 TaxID=1618761 RepID=A0A0G0B865_9BACT|nr:MAG: NAD-dependent epimerase/dehydratase [Candidatus Nomurabacteria bacterium GW2011_GWE1_35_16]
MSKVLVTGAFGFVGQWLVKELLDRGMDIVVTSHDNMELLRGWGLKDVVLEQGDIRDYGFITKIFDSHQIDSVFHLAAQALVSEALKNPRETMETNAMGTANLLEALRIYNGVRRIVVASSDKAYGNEQSPYNENTPLNGRFPYDCSKSCTDLISQSYRDTYVMPISILRCGNIFGGGDLNWNRIFPEAIRSCYVGRPMDIRSDGISMMRDYIYIEDVIDAYLFVSNLEHNEIVNVAYGKAKTVLDVLSAVQKHTGVYITPDIKNTAKCEIDIQCLDSEHMNSLGWQPSYNFDKGVEKTVTWYYDYFMRSSYRD